MFISFIKGRRI